MNVKELKERLEEIPDHYTILVDGYESGHDEADTILIGTYGPYGEDYWFYGRHEFRPNKQGNQPAVLLGIDRHGSVMQEEDREEDQ